MSQAAVKYLSNPTAWGLVDPRLASGVESNEFEVRSWSVELLVDY